MTLLELFINLGYTKKEYELIRNDYTFRRVTNDTLYNNVLRNYKWLSLLYGKKNVKKITTMYPTIYGLKTENMDQQIEDIINLGYTRKDVIKMTKNCPMLYGYSIDTIKEKIKSMESIGYSYDDVMKMTKLQPSIFNYSIENMCQKIDNIVELGYTREEVINMTKTCPQLYGYGIENIRAKIDFYDSINMHELANVHSTYLMQSVDLSYARYCFYQDKGVNITIDNYAKLFCSNKVFKKTYGINKKELIKKYNYDKYLKEKKSGRVI